MGALPISGAFGAAGAAGGANFGGVGAAALGGAIGTLSAVFEPIPPEMIRVYSLGPPATGGGLDNGGLTTEKTCVAPAGIGGSGSRNVPLTDAFCGIGSMDGVTGGLALRGGAVQAASLDSGDTSLFGATGSQVCDGVFAGGATAG